ncbi:hypothetical protein [Pseudoalteromonas sp. GABNS16H]|uniref:hypothetical protein n=1 Tax=Pseudoalteromonas sp. GABNS16H TaxID=3025325 RepID=UPI00236042E9|nr:hypothetical protein [Pseudoalteromonas sp. GABNS16H]MDC9611625.1 hypothetical protein [Pseudoalteromonas sp. GABNS16H]
MMSTILTLLIGAFVATVLINALSRPEVVTSIEGTMPFLSGNFDVLKIAVVLVVAALTLIVGALRKQSEQP